MYHYTDFDPEIVAKLRPSGKRPGITDDDGMLCPIAGHEAHWLKWKGARAGGTIPHGEPPARWHTEPTYVLIDPAHNLIVSPELAIQATSLGKAEARLGHENSEDAVSWNVFRSLQEAGLLAAAAKVLTGVQPQTEPLLFMWSLETIHQPDGFQPWPRLAEVRKLLEPGGGQKTEPDICLYVHGWGWILVEAKFGAGVTLCNDADHLQRWKAHYAGKHGAAVFDQDAIAAAPLTKLPEQLLRNVLFAHHIRGDGEQTALVALTREDDANPTPMVTALLADPSPLPVIRRTWELLYREICLKNPGALASLRAYYETKSLKLQPAFHL